MSFTAHCANCRAKLTSKSQPDRDIKCPKCRAIVSASAWVVAPAVLMPVEQLEEAFAAPDETLAAVPRRRAAVLIGAGAAVAIVLLVGILAAVVALRPAKETAALPVSFRELVSVQLKAADPAEVAFKAATKTFCAEATALCRLLGGVPSLEDFNRNASRMTDAFVRIPNAPKDAVELEEAKALAKEVKVNLEAQGFLIKTGDQLLRLGDKTSFTKSVARVKEQASKYLEKIAKIEVLIGERTSLGESAAEAGDSKTDPAADPGARPKVVQVKGYTRKDGTYVGPHTRSAPTRR